MYKIGKFSKLTVISISTLREWDKKGILKPKFKTPKGIRFYNEEQLQTILQKRQSPNRINIGYARVSSKKQEDDLKRQVMIALNQIDKVYILYRDRLVRFGFELIEEFAKLHNTTIEIINQSEEKTDEEELVEDILI